MLRQVEQTGHVWAKTGAAGAELYTQDYGDAARSVSSSSWTQVTLAGVTVTSGQAKVGVKSGGQTVKVDDFNLSLTVE
ncbi:MAG TPA: hypothetical protein VLC09_04635 [Polyangiaceae bacterium]|nr:hypothetical protein [Polyangiaceae bacterium]